MTELLVLLRALFAFRATHGALPTPGSTEQAAEVVQLATAISAAAGPDALGSVPADVFAQLARHSAGALSPMAAFLGGIVGQEARTTTGHGVAGSE
jgi:hypothetical protein